MGYLLRVVGTGKRGVLGVNSRLSVSGNFCTVNESTLSVKTGAFRFFAHGPHNKSTEGVSARSIGTLVGLVRRGGFSGVLTRTPCAVGLYSTGPRAHRFTLGALASSLGQVRCLPGGLCGFRPNDRAKRNIGTTIRRVNATLGATVFSSVAAAMLLRAVTNGNARINEAFRRLHVVVSHIRQGSGVNTYLSAYRIFSTNCSVIGGLSKILRRFSHMVKLRELGTVRLGSDVGPVNGRGSERRGVNRNCVKVSTFKGVVGGRGLQGLPFFLRAPGRLSNCTGRVSTLEGLCFR